jgi:hypothetical protein
MNNLRKSKTTKLFPKLLTQPADPSSYDSIMNWLGSTGW